MLQFFSGVLSDILLLKKSSPHVAHSKRTSSMRVASPPGISGWYRKQEVNLTEMKTNETSVCLQKRAQRKHKLPALIWRLLHSRARGNIVTVNCTVLGIISAFLNYWLEGGHR